MANDIFSMCLSDVLIGAIERYLDRTSHYPNHALSDNIYRNRANLVLCKLHESRLLDSALGRLKKSTNADKKAKYTDNTKRSKIEKAFSLSKRCYRLGRITT